MGRGKTQNNAESDEISHLEFHPVTAERWGDMVKLFEHHGNPGYCWCMLWRLPTAAYRQLDSAGRKDALQALVDAGVPTGIVAYQDAEPVGWCSVAPRPTYQRLERSRSLHPLDERRTWSVVCFYLHRNVRHGGLSVKLLQAAVEYAFSQGAEVVEGYPIERYQDEEGNWQPVASYRFMGSVATFEKAGFRQAGMAGDRRIMRIFAPDVNR
jgi:GNAT superfamily N-acetyltransferase